MTRYAATTSVSAEQSRGEIERTLQRYGADAFAYGWEGTKALVQFRAHDRYIRFVLPLPSPDEKRFTHYKRGTTSVTWHPRTPDAARKEYEQAIRQRWRALALCIKAKLEAVESEISTFEEEFLAHVVLPDGTTFGQWASGELEEVYATGRMPRFLPELGPGPSVEAQP